MNKEVKAIVEYLNEEKEAIRKGFYYPNDVLSYEDLTTIIDYINQLETNWDELKGWLKANDIHYAEAIPFRETLNKMQELERGKE